MLTRQPKENVFKVTLTLCYEQKGFFVEALCVTRVSGVGRGAVGESIEYLVPLCGRGGG